jgi:KEOPS complex subunit Pcc1
LKLVTESVFETDAALSVYRSLLPEIESQVTDRSSIDLRPEGSYLYLTVEADDLVSMRSTLNTWLRLIQVALEVSALADNS